MQSEQKDGVQELGEVLGSESSVNENLSEQLADKAEGDSVDLEHCEAHDGRSVEGNSDVVDPDVLDASPVSRRRSVLVLTSMVILFAMAIGVLIWMPPLSWTPEKSKADNYQALTAVTEVFADLGKVGEHDVAYRLVTESLVYRVSFEQSIRYVGGRILRTVLNANVTFSRPERRETEDTVALRFSEVDVHVFDAEQEVKLSGSGGMFEGVDMYSRLGERDGLVSVVPDSNVNPQVARVLFVLLDCMRSIWLPLPSQKVSVGDSWAWSDLPKVGDDVRVGRTTFKSLASDGGFELKHMTELYGKSQGERKKLGTGAGEAHMVSGLLTEATYEATCEGGSEGALGLTLKVSVERVATP